MKSEHLYTAPTDIVSEKISHSAVTQTPFNSHWCPGCGHGSLMHAITQTIDRLHIQESVIFSVGVGCGSAITSQINCNSVLTPHGRASDVATGLSRMLPEKTVVQYSGDGDSCAIGLAGLIHACNRKENFLIFIYNNNVYGMTGGQIGPTTSSVIPTTTFQQGRPEDIMGYPIDIIKVVSSLKGVAFAARCSVSSPKNIIKSQKIIEKAFKLHLDGNKGIKIVDCLGNCNVNWKGENQTFTPLTANQLIDEEIVKHFPLGVFKDCTKKDLSK